MEKWSRNGHPVWLVTLLWVFANSSGTSCREQSFVFCVLLKGETPNESRGETGTWPCVGSGDKGWLRVSINSCQLGCELRTALSWIIIQQVVVIPYRGFGSAYRSHLQGTRFLLILDPCKAQFLSTKRRKPKVTTG